MLTGRLVNIIHPVVQLANSSRGTVTILNRVLVRDSTVFIIANTVIDLFVQVIDCFYYGSGLGLTAILILNVSRQLIRISNIRRFSYVIDDDCTFILSSSIDDVHGYAVMLIPLIIGRCLDIISTCFNMLFILSSCRRSRRNGFS